MFRQARRQPVFVSYHGYPNMWHARFLISEVQDFEWITVTPDGDMYPEDLSPGSQEIRGIMDRASQDVLPYPLTVGGAQVYDFDAVVSTAQLDLKVRDADVLARAERDRRGLPDVVERVVHHRVSGKQPRAALFGGTPGGDALVAADGRGIAADDGGGAGLGAYLPTGPDPPLGGAGGGGPHPLLGGWPR